MSVWLYLVERDGETLNLPPHRISRHLLLRRPLMLRLHYLVMSMVDYETREQAAELEQLILGEILQVFHDEASLAGARLVNKLSVQPLSLEELTRVWDALEQPYQPCGSYEVGVVPIESAEAPAHVMPVDALTTDTGLARLLEDARCDGSKSPTTPFGASRPIARPRWAIACARCCAHACSTRPRASRSAKRCRSRSLASISRHASSVTASPVQLRGHPHLPKQAHQG